MSNFKIGDVVVCVDNHNWPHELQLGKQYTISTLHTNSLGQTCKVVGKINWFLVECFELRKENEMQQSTEQKTKIITPSRVADWHKAVGMYFGGVKVKEFKYVATEYEVAVCFISNFSDDTFDGVFYKGGFDREIQLEIPVTTKRIPFDPKRKDAKVFHGEFEVVEWYMFSNNIVAGICKDNPTIVRNCLSNNLEMEIEE